MEQALKIYDELVSQVKKFNRFKNEEEEMEFKFGESSKKVYEIKSSIDEQEAILRCILTGYFTNIAQFQGDGTYLNIRSKEKLTLHSTSIASVVYP
jgi:ATP-dependent RNA helicase DDX35